MNKLKLARTQLVIVGMFAALLLAGCTSSLSPGADDSSVGSGLPIDAANLARDRGFSQDDIYAALKTYMPTGEYDPYMMFASGGQSGQVLVIGVPSMRILKIIGVFTPEPWQGYGYGAGNEILAAGDVSGETVSWGDTHHPALSETNGVYDGRFLFINDKSNARMAVIDLRDFATKQILKNPNALSDHGGAFVTPDTKYVVEGPQYAVPLGWDYAPLDQYEEKYRGILTFWAFDAAAGRLDPSKSFQMELPPYWQDLCDAGKGPSEGLIFCNSINSELSTGMNGTDPKASPPFEVGVSRNDMDFLHVIDWHKAEAVYEAGKTELINGMPVIRLSTANSENLLRFVPEPKSPHGSDVTPGGEYVVVGGKLDPHVSVYSVAKIKQEWMDAEHPKDQYGIPIIPFDKALEAQVELGLGPLHTVYDDQGYAYTSLFLDSAVARWSLGGPYSSKHPEEPWTLIQKIPTSYNIGHLTAIEGDTATPGHGYVVALNKWSIDRFANVGPLLPQNLQLIDSSQTGPSMRLLYDMPLGMAEPHYAQIIRADRLHPMEVYPQVGWDADTMGVDPNATTDAKEARVVRHGEHEVEIWMTAVRSHFTPENIEIRKGDHVVWHITSLERTRDATHGFQLSGYNIQLSLEPGRSITFEFTADEEGTFVFYCTEFCSALHLEMMGYFLVQPA